MYNMAPFISLIFYDSRGPTVRHKLNFIVLINNYTCFRPSILREISPQLLNQYYPKESSSIVINFIINLLIPI